MIVSLGAIALGISGCDLFSSHPSADVAAGYMNNIVGKLIDPQITNCSGDTEKQTCVVSYKRTFAGNSYYEELSMNFQKTPSGWNVLGYSVIKTDTL